MTTEELLHDLLDIRSVTVERTFMVSEPDQPDRLSVRNGELMILHASSVMPSEAMRLRSSRDKGLSGEKGIRSASSDWSSTVEIAVSAELPISIEWRQRKALLAWQHEASDPGHGVFTLSKIFGTPISRFLLGDAHLDAPLDAALHPRLCNRSGKSQISRLKEQRVQQSRTTCAF